MKGRHARGLTTALGPVSVNREYYWNEDGGVFRADAVLGIDGPRTRQAIRLIALAAVDNSFARSQFVLREFCGWTIDDETIRRTTHAEAKRASVERPTRADATRFAAAPGAIEILIDAGKVNTLEGWRDVKIGLVLRREAGCPATPAQWDTRRLPHPTIQTTVAAIEGCGEFATRVRAETDRLHATSDTGVSVLGDGAEWIWNLAGIVVPQAAHVLDVYHALEHVGDAAKAIWGVGTEASKAQMESGRAAVLAEGKVGLERWLGAAFAEVPEGIDPESLVALAAYFAKHPTRLDYAGRLAAGQSIGSGAVEGSIKQNVNLRLKRSGARWKAEHVGPLIELRALSHEPEWQNLWTAV